MITQEQIQEMQKNRFAKLDQIQKQCVFDVDDKYWHLHCADEGWFHDVVQRLHMTKTQHIAFFIKTAEVFLRSALQTEPLANMDHLWVQMRKAFPLPEDHDMLRDWVVKHGNLGYLPLYFKEQDTVVSWLQIGMKTHYSVVATEILREMFHESDPNGLRCEPPS